MARLGSLVVVALALAAITPHTSAGGKPQGDIDFGRIVGGTPTSAKQFPWQLYVRIGTDGGTYVCGGSIISQTWAMSAAHCFTDGDPDDDEGFIVTATKITLFAGATNKYEVYSDPNVQINEFVESEFDEYVFINQDYMNDAWLNNDITIFKLKKPLTLTEYVQPIALATPDDFIPGKELTVSGWGRTSPSGSTSSILLYVAGLFLIPRSECKSYWGTDSITDNMICHKTSNKNTCGGDSGGPVITGSGNSNGPPYVQTGIVSWGSRTCDAYIPKVFVDVAKFRGWIDTTISKSSCPDRSSTCPKLAAQGKCKKAKVFNKCKASCAC
ncbi:unnamed protein product, partial [Meganyctiphanes norvegica]